ncbi:hypothetical protein KP004_09220 [Geomonas oryzisoli]|uniref:Uncharacterized protein n=1 Tax=Geomonas oryzisoli TaxID=2847992 RepID=A0ABX8JAE5_9BACT|nr:hypothetical protein [Geomonas oryzisoli]QWV95330.1 hypothetical protein KP004_09220 [Geomonas oryzisoli]
MQIRIVIAALLLGASFIAPQAWASEPIPASLPTTATPAAVAVPQVSDQAAAIAALTKENALLQERIKSLESCSISSTDLAARNSKKLKEITADVRSQRQAMAEFESYVKWMSGHVASYSKYIQASSVAARFVKFFPIPYAGQASLFTKFVSDSAVSLAAASVSINKYLGTSQQFLSRADALDPNKPTYNQDVSDLVRFADHDLLKGMTEVQDRLTTTSQLSASSLSFLESVNHYVGSGDEALTKAKSFLKSDDKAEKSFLAESTASLKNKAQVFNGKLQLFDATVKKTSPQIKALVAYDDLARSLDPKFAKK